MNELNTEICREVNSKECVDTFVRQCRDLVTGETLDRSFEYVYITKENTERLLAIIECLSKRDDRKMLEDELSNAFTSFLAKDAKEVLSEIVKVNESLRLTWGEISGVSKSVVDLGNTRARIMLRRTVGDALMVLTKYVSETEPVDGIIFDDFVLNDPFVKVLSQSLLDEVEDRVNRICLDFCRGFARCYPEECYAVDLSTYAWVELYEDDYLTNPCVNELINSSVKYDLNEGPTGGGNYPHEFCVFTLMGDDLWISEGPRLRY